MPVHFINKENSRRKFIGESIKAAGSLAILSSPLVNFAGVSPVDSTHVTVGDIMDAFINEVAGAPFATTVDTLKSGSREIKVKGIVTTMFATIPLIQKAIAAGANFIIAHEPTFYNHADDTEWLERDDVYRFKARLLEEHQIAIWRNHDYIHRHKPDGVLAGVVEKLGWNNYYNSLNNIATIPGTSLKSLIAKLKADMGIEMLRYMGDLSQTCTKILLLPGAAGGRRQIEAISRLKPDVLICGEIAEWETAEYTRDVQASGQQFSLVVLGHIASEEPGSGYMASWLKKKFPAIPSKHIPAENSLKFS